MAVAEAQLQPAARLIGQREPGAGQVVLAVQPLVAQPRGTQVQGGAPAFAPCMAPVEQHPRVADGIGALVALVVGLAGGQGEGGVGARLPFQTDLPDGAFQTTAAVVLVFLALVAGADLPAGSGRGFPDRTGQQGQDRKSTRLNSSHVKISYAVFCLKKKQPIQPSSQ